MMRLGWSTRGFGGFAVLMAGVIAGCSSGGGPGPSGSAAPAKAPAGTASVKESNMNTEKAMFGAGCFWGVEETFRQLPGVVSTAVGYAGGKTENPTYKEVCTDKTGHAEVVLIEYEPGKVSYEQLLDIFWKVHDPTQLNRQGPDVGTQYRSAIFYFSPEQQATAAASKEKLAASGKFNRPVVTEISPAPAFYRAEDYHQQYLLKTGQANCHLPIER